MRIVQKYGGTSLATRERICTAARRAAELVGAGHQVVLVVSAQGQSTDALLARAVPFHPEDGSRELDACLAVGEQLSAAFMAMALQEIGAGGISLTGWQAGIQTDSRYGNARITGIRTERLERELTAGHIPVVAGFQGIDPGGNITTLGRGGSDTTAVALAAALGAEKCQIFTDVDGVYDRDPRLYPDAVRYRKIGYDRMLRLAQGGAQVLHDRCVALAKEKGIVIEVLSAFTSAPGTLVTDAE